MELILTIIFAAIALGVIIAVVVRKFPQLAAMNVEDAPQERLRRLKQALVAGRMVRKLRAVEKRVLSRSSWERIQYLVKEAYGNLKILEEKYRVRTNDAKVELLLKRGREHLTEEVLVAEQCFLDVITLDPRNLEAYEGLSKIYRIKKDFHEAIEILEFLVKLNPAAQGRYHFELAEAFLAYGNAENAWQYATQALQEESANPKYLDFLIELAILKGQIQAGQQYLAKLVEVNPENAKIVEWEQKLKIRQRSSVVEQLHGLPAKA